MSTVSHSFQSNIGWSIEKFFFEDEILLNLLKEHCRCPTYVNFFVKSTKLIECVLQIALPPSGRFLELIAYNNATSAQTPNYAILRSIFVRNLQFLVSTTLFCISRFHYC